MIQRSQADHIYSLLVVVGGITLVVALLCVLITLGRNYLGLSRKNGWLLGIAVTAAAIVAGLYRGREVRTLLNIEAPLPGHFGTPATGLPGQSHIDDTLSYALATAALVFFGLPFVFKIYRAWTDTYITDAENAPGSRGVRAWLSPANLVLVALISFLAGYGYGYSFLPVFVLLLLILLIYPIANTMNQNNTPPSHEHLTSERERVLSMLDAGKITAEESAELLNALAATVHASEQSPTGGGLKVAKVVPGRQMILTGAALVLIGFFLPWLSVDIGKEMQRVTSGMASIGNMTQQIGNLQASINFPTNGGQNPMGFPFKMPVVNIAGGDVPHGLGWLVLMLSLGVAILSCVETTLDSRSKRTMNMVALGAGVFILLYLCANNLRFLNAGILLAAAGYAVEFVAVMRSTRAIPFQREMHA